MTQDQRQHQDAYDHARRDYDNASAAKRNAENEIIGIQNRRKQIVNEINSLESEKKLNEESLTELQKTTQHDSDISSGITDAATKLDTAATGFLAIGSASSCQLKNLNNVFDERDRNARTRISGIFENINSAKLSITSKINELTGNIRRLENEMEEGKQRERSLNNSIAEYSRAMSNASYSMAYHKRCMEQ